MAHEKVLKTAFIAAASLFAVVPGFGAELSRANYTMGTLLEITLTGDTTAQLAAAAENIFTEVDRWDRLLSTYKPDSEISRVNARAPEAVEVSSDTIAAVQAALEWAARTDGRFDPTVGPLVDLWGFRGGPARLPAKEEIARKLPLIGFKNVHVGRDTVALASAGMSLDFGGIGKGWALDRALERISGDPAVKSAVMNFGGQILFWSRAPHVWPSAVRDPEKPGGIFSTFEVRENGSLSTSAQSEHFVTATDPKDPIRKYPHKYGHILDPRTGYSVESVESVTVWSPIGTEADALSTALFVMGPEEGMSFSERNRIAVDMIYIDKKNGRTEAKSSAWPFGK